MGTGQAFKCSKCGHEYEVLEGIGMLSNTIYTKLTNNIKSGKYGETLKDILLNDENITVDIGNCLYICNCNNWVVEPSLSFYSEDKLIREYKHICKKCGSEMTETEATDDLLLPCPECGSMNKANGPIWWD